MFKKLLDIFKPRSGNSKPEENTSENLPTPPKKVKFKLSFWGLKVDMEDPNGWAAFIAILFFIAVILIVLFLRDYIHQIQIIAPAKKVISYLSL